MTDRTFIKTLSANDVGTTGGHMGGILVPKGNGELLTFLPSLDPKTLNPSAWIDCEAGDGRMFRLRYVYYNNRLHAPKGTRNEYRITHLTNFLRSENAQEGDMFEISRREGSELYRMRVIARRPETAADELSDGPVRIKLSFRWRRVH